MHAGPRAAWQRCASHFSCGRVLDAQGSACLQRRAPPCQRPSNTPTPTPIPRAQRPKTVMTQQVIQQPVTTLTQQTYMDTQMVTRPVVTTTVRRPPPAARGGAAEACGRPAACSLVCAPLDSQLCCNPVCAMHAPPLLYPTAAARPLALTAHSQPVLVNKPSLAVTATFGKGKGIVPTMVDNPQVKPRGAGPCHALAWSSIATETSRLCDCGLSVHQSPRP